MDNKDKRLEQLLSNLEVDKTSLGFTNDIMQMISKESLSQDPKVFLTILESADQAPMHMTDIVMDSIQNPPRKTYHLLSPKEKINSMLILGLVILVGVVGALLSRLTYDPTIIVHSLRTLITEIPQSGTALLICGTILWILDQQVRSRLSI